MRVLLSGGGTAGHINPALAIASKLSERYPDCEFLFVGANGRMETELVPKAGYPFKSITVKGFSRKLTPKGIAHNLSAAYHAVASGQDCSRILKEFKPDLCIGTGGYVCGPILRKAAQKGIPVVLHESNAFPGVTVKMLAKAAKVVCVATEEAIPRLPEGTNAVVTGNPLRDGFLNFDKTTARAELGLDERPFVLSLGGSLGALKINELMAQVLTRAADDRAVCHLHATGKAEYDEFMETLAANGAALADSGIEVRPYIDDMPRCMAAADLVVCRCGAMTTTELLAAGKPSVLIPSPNVAENHQFYNAQALVHKGAAVCIEEKDLTADGLFETIRALTADPAKLSSMAQNAKNAAITDAADRIADVIDEVLSARG